MAALMRNLLRAALPAIEHAAGAPLASAPFRAMHLQRVLPVALPKLDVVSVMSGYWQSPPFNPDPTLAAKQQKQRSILLGQGAPDQEADRRTCPVGPETVRQDRCYQGTTS